MNMINGILNASGIKARFVFLIIISISPCLIHSQSYGYFGKSWYLDLDINISQRNPAAPDFLPYNLQPDISIRKIISPIHELALGFGYFMNSWDMFGSPADDVKGFVANFSWRIFRSKRYNAVAPIGRFLEFEFPFSYNQIHTLSYSNPPYPLIGGVNGNAILFQPAFKMGRQGVFNDRVTASGGFRIAMYPVYLYKDPAIDNSASSFSVQDHLFVKNLFSIVFSMGYLL